MIQACGVGHTTESTNCCSESFAAAPGWDAVTGLGSPNFATISNLVLNNQSAFPAAGSYPAGSSTSSDINTENDDDDSADYEDIAAAALAISLVSLIVVLYALYKSFSNDR